MNDVSSPVGSADATDDKLFLSASEPFKTERISTANASENSILTEELLKVVPLVRRIVRHNLFGSHNRQAADDVEQRVLLSLWQWRGRNSDRKLTTIEMEKIAARSAKRGAQAYYRQEMRNATDPQVDFDSDNDAAQVCRTNFNRRNADNDGSENFYAGQIVSFMGDTIAEAASLGKFLFREIEKLSMRQRFALLLQKNDLIVHLVATRACRTSDLAAALDLSRADFFDVLRRLPLSDEEIGEIWQERSGEKLTAKQVWEARCKARVKIKQVLRCDLTGHQ